MGRLIHPQSRSATSMPPEILFFPPLIITIQRDFFSPLKMVLPRSAIQAKIRTGASTSDDKIKKK